MLKIGRRMKTGSRFKLGCESVFMSMWCPTVLVIWLQISTSFGRPYWKRMKTIYGRIYNCFLLCVTDFQSTCPRQVNHAMGMSLLQVGVVAASGYRGAMATTTHYPGRESRERFLEGDWQWNPSNPKYWIWKHVTPHQFRCFLIGYPNACCGPDSKPWKWSNMENHHLETGSSGLFMPLLHHLRVIM